MKLLGYPSLLLKTPALLYCSVTGCLTKRAPYRKEKFLVRWKRYTVEEDTWKNLENTKELVEEFEREYGKEAKELR